MAAPEQLGAVQGCVPRDKESVAGQPLCSLHLRYNPTGEAAQGLGNEL